MANNLKNNNKETVDKSVANEPVLTDEEKSNYLMTSGLLEAYEYVLKSLCKAGLPDGNIYEFAALKVLKFEKNFTNEIKKKEQLLKYKEKLESISKKDQ